MFSFFSFSHGLEAIPLDFFAGFSFLTLNPRPAFSFLFPSRLQRKSESFFFPDNPPFA